MSITPAPNCCPNADCNVNIGKPMTNDKMKNWKIKFAPKCIDNIAKRHMLNKPSVQPRQANIELKPCGHCPNGLSISGTSVALL